MPSYFKTLISKLDLNSFNNQIKHEFIGSVLGTGLISFDRLAEICIN